MTNEEAHRLAREKGVSRPLYALIKLLVTPFFREGAPRDFADASACDLDAYGRFCRAMLDRGIYPPPSQFEAWFVSLAHDRAAIERTVDAARESFTEALG